MDFVTLNPDGFGPLDLIEGYTSIIWTERHLVSGDFEITSPYIQATRAKLPFDTLVSLRDTDEVMIVENHDITPGPEGYPELKVSGRSFETFLEQRGAIPVFNASNVTYFTGSVDPASGIVELINNQIRDGYLSAYDEFDGLVLAVDATTGPDADENFKIEYVDLYTQVQNMCARAGFGVRTSRLADPGVIQIRIYRGVDRSQDQDDRDPVIFLRDAGEVNDPKYLFTKKNFKNIAYVWSPAGSQIVVPVGGSSSVSGLSRRVLHVMADDIEDVDPGTTLEELLTHRGRAELKKHNKTFFFDGEVSPLTTHKYKRDYYLGDKVTLMGDYGIHENMIVGEYIRTEDAEGERGYPTLVDPGTGG